MRFIHALVLCLTLGLTTSASQADPGPATRKMSLRAGAVFGFGGEVDIETESGGQKSKSKDDLETTKGFRLHFEYPLHQYFGVGLLTAFRWVNTDGNDSQNVGSSLMLAINVAPRVRYPMLHGRLEAYLMLPIGLDITIPNSDMEPPGGSLSAGAAFSLGFFPGIQYLFTDAIGAYFELGFRTTNLSFSRSQQQAKEDISTSGLQFHLTFGGIFAF